MSLRAHGGVWNRLAKSDPYWAILSDPAKRGGRWDVDEFFETGDVEVRRLLEVAAELGRPIRGGTALDFGCGLGRMTRALARHCESCLGLDISSVMIESARELNHGLPNCRFEVNDRPDLVALADGSFDLVYSVIVLQHLPRRSIMRRYIREFVRVLRPGGMLVFQVPSGLPWRDRIQPRPRTYYALSAMGLSDKLLLERLRLHPMRMNFLPQEDVTTLLAELGAQLLRASDDIHPSMYYATR